MRGFLTAVFLLAVICGVIWGFQPRACPKCGGKGQFSRQVENKKTCSTCKGNRKVHCDYYRTGEESYIECKSGVAHRYFKTKKWLFNQNPSYYLYDSYTCPQCNGTKLKNCSSCKGYGYFTTTSTEYDTDYFCDGGGEVTNFKVLFD